MPRIYTCCFAARLDAGNQGRLSMKVLNKARLKQQIVKNTAEVQGMCFYHFSCKKK